MKGKLSDMLFIFWVGNGAYLVVVALTVMFFLFGDCFKIIKDILYPLIISTFIYAICSTFYLLGLVIRFGYFIDIHDKNLNKDK